MTGYPFLGIHDEVQLAAAATLVAADLVMTPGYDPPAVPQNLELSATAIASRGMGLRATLRSCGS